MKMFLRFFHFSVLCSFLAITTSGVSAMPGETQSPANPVAVKSGRDAATRYCSRCHSVAPGKWSPNKNAPTFLSIAAKYKNHDMAGLKIYDGTVYRHPGMPQFELKTYEADGLIAYLRWLARQKR